MNVRVLQTNEPSRFSGIPESDEILMLYGRELPFLMFLACVVIFFKGNLLQTTQLPSFY